MSDPSRQQAQHPPQPPQSPSRRRAVMALVLGSAGLAGWTLHQRVPSGRGSASAPDGVGDDVCVVAPPTPYDPAGGQALADAREVPADARCPVCGMYPARARAWAAQVIFSDGDAFFFDSPLSLMLYLGNVAHYTRGRTAEAIVARYVTDTHTGQWLHAQQAVYVTGSSAMGPMRAGNLPAFADTGAAQQFVQQRGGRALAFNAIDAAVLRKLAPNLRADHRQHTG